MKSLARIATLTLVCATTCAVGLGQQAGTPAAQTQGKGHLAMVVMLTRHGVRSPTWTQERLDSYSAQPWPKWGVPPGNLTSRGRTLVQMFATYDRAALAEKGLVSAGGCADAAHTYLWADTDQRTMETGRALGEGLFPGCAVEVHGLAAGENDPLFHPAAKGVTGAKADAAFAEFAQRAKQTPATQQAALLEEMQRVLLGCDPKRVCTATHAPEMTLPDGPMTAERGKGDHLADLQGPLASASTLAEDLLLEYADGMPAEQVGWGKVDEGELRRLLALHSDYFELMHRTPAMARLEASNMLWHLVRTLEQGVQRAPVAGAFGPVDSKIVMVAGHDTNLAGVAALLGLRWKLDGREDDTPPGTELAFELWQDEAGGYSVRVTVEMQTLRQMRELTPLTMAAPPARESLTLTQCGTESCGWEAFRSTADGAVDRTSVY